MLGKRKRELQERKLQERNHRYVCDRWSGKCHESPQDVHGMIPPNVYYDSKSRCESKCFPLPNDLQQHIAQFLKSTEDKILSRSSHQVSPLFSIRSEKYIPSLAERKSLRSPEWLGKSGILDAFYTLLNLPASVVLNELGPKALYRKYEIGRKWNRKAGSRFSRYPDTFAEYVKQAYLKDTKNEVPSSKWLGLLSLEYTKPERFLLVRLFQGILEKNDSDMAQQFVKFLDRFPNKHLDRFTQDEKWPPPEQKTLQIFMQSPRARKILAMMIIWTQPLAPYITLLTESLLHSSADEDDEETLIHLLWHNRSNDPRAFRIMLKLLQVKRPALVKALQAHFGMEFMNKYLNQ